MEGNDCYKYRTVQRFVEATGAAPISTILEVGANVGSVTRELAATFPDARILSWEMMDELAAVAREATADCPNVTVETATVTAAHLYHDDLGERPRSEPARLHAFQGLPSGGPGYRGGSLAGVAGRDNGPHYRERPEALECLTLDEAVALVLSRFGGDRIDFLKTDCEGSECSFLGCAAGETLRRIRFMAGEYHNLGRFWPVARKLMETHYVNLIGDDALGAFFCERISDRPTLLKPTPLGPRRYPHLHEEPLYWHPFDESWIPTEEWLIHGITGRPAQPVARPTDAFIVCGAVSSGNRLLSSILCRSGCTGEPSTLQPETIDQLPHAGTAPYVCIKHEDLAKWIEALRARGFRRIVAIVIVREPVAHVASILARGHATNVRAARRGRVNATAANIRDAVASGAELEIITYEGLTEPFLKKWLPDIGLPYRPGPLAMPGQHAPSHIENQNLRHYAT